MAAAAEGSERQEAKWEEALGWLKEREMQRQVGFREWQERASAVLALERKRSGSAQQLIATVKAQIRERAEVDEEFAKSLTKLANERDAAKSKKTLLWTDEDRADAGYLTEMQRHCARLMEEGAKACRAALEGSQSLQRLEDVGRGVMKNLPAAEQALKATELKQARCVSFWEKHEALCRQRLQPKRNAAAAGDLWRSEVAYRRAVASFDEEAKACQKLMGLLQQDIAGAAEQHRSLVQQVLKDVAACLSALYSSMSASLDTGSSVVPRLSEKEAPAQLPPLEPTLPRLPASAFILRQGPVQRPPRRLSLFGAWRSRQLLLTTDGYLYCFDDAVDVAAKEPVWSIPPSQGSSLAADESSLQLTFLPASGWGWSRGGKQRMVRLPSAEQLAAWRQVLRPWWPPAGAGAALAAQSAAAAQAAAGPGDDDSGDDRPVKDSDEESRAQEVSPQATGDCSGAQDPEMRRQASVPEEPPDGQDGAAAAGTPAHSAEAHEAQVEASGEGAGTEAGAHETEEAPK